MFTLLATLGACLASSLGIARLASGNAKRRRVYGLPPLPPPGPAARLAINLLILAPGAGLLCIGDAAGFVIWLGVLSLLGWLAAARRPRGSRGKHAGDEPQAAA